MPTRAVLLVLTTLLISASFSTTTIAQKLVRVEEIVSPHPNFELCLGTDLEPRATFRITGNDPLRLRLQLTIRNEVTGVKIYGDTVIIDNIPSGITIARTFKIFLTNPNILSQIGRHRLSAIVNAVDANGDVLPDINASDTMWINMFGIRRTAQPFNDASDNYSVLSAFDSISIPDQHKWISHGATAVDAEGLTFDPLSPRAFEEDTLGYGPLKYRAPAIMLDRRNTQGVVYQGLNVGDTLISYPINFKGVTRTSIFVSYHRSTKRQYGWGYDHDTLYGPENTIVTYDGVISRPGDSLLLEIRDPADSACDDVDARWVRVAGVDGGKDFGYERIIVDLSTRDSNKPGYHNFFTQNFRMRLRLVAKADATLGAGVDDDDAWYLDNLSVQSPRHIEGGIVWSRAVSNYTKMPASQSVYRIYAKFAINPSGTTFSEGTIEIKDPNHAVKYQHTFKTQYLRRDTILQFPNWNASNEGFFQGQRYTIIGTLGEGFDSYDDDNEGRSQFYLTTAHDLSQPQEFALDDGTNDYPELGKRAGLGVGFISTSGSYAMRFELAKPDTLFGARAYFASLNQSPDAIRILAYKDSADLPATMIADAVLQTSRGAEGFDRFSAYRFDKPIALDSGVYWIAVSQLGLDNMHLGADISRRGADLYDAGQALKMRYIHNDPYGYQYDPVANFGDVSKSVAYEIPAGSGNWKQFTGEDALNGSNGLGQGGSFIPMIRPLVGSGPAVASVQTAIREQRIAAYPNPFIAGKEVVKLSLGCSPTHSNITITNLLGQRVRCFDLGSASEWDGKDDQGYVVSAGVYILCLDDQSPTFILAR